MYSKSSKIIKWAKRIVLLSLLLALLLLTSAYWYITTEWKNYYTKNEIIEIVDEINKAPQLSQTFYDISDKLNRIDRHHSLTFVYSKFILDELGRKKRRRIQSSFHHCAQRMRGLKNMGCHTAFKLSWALEKYGSAQKCFDYVMYNDFKNLIREEPNIPDITQTNDTTAILEFLIKAQNSTLYKHRPELLQTRLEALRAELLE